jgi:hypothetical protein
MAADNLETFIPVVATQFDTYRKDGVLTEPGVIKKPANMDRGAKANVVEWVLIFPRLFMELGDPTFVGVPTAIAEALG